MIGEYEQGFYGGQYASKAPLLDVGSAAGLLSPGCGGRALQGAVRLSTGPAGGNAAPGAEADHPDRGGQRGHEQPLPVGCSAVENPRDVDSRAPDTLAAAHLPEKARQSAGVQTDWMREARHPPRA